MENYILYLKNESVLKIQYENNTMAFGDIVEIYKKNLIPIGLLTYPKTLNTAIQIWWQSRIIPKNRESLKENELSQIYKNTFGFNLSDNYWLKPENSDMTWEKGNFYTNDFNEEIGKYITGISNSNPDFENMKTDTPDLFSNGEQDKRWVIENKKRCLLKYGRPAYYQQPFNEYLASEICKCLNFNHVPYSIKTKGKKKLQIYSSCNCFIDEHTEYVTAGYIQFVKEKNNSTSSFDHLINCCTELQMPQIDEIKKNIYQMIFLDYIVANTDRHYGNFGFIRNIETLEWKGFAPIFDTGNSMFYETSTTDLIKSKSIMENVKSRSFYKTQEACLKKFSTEIALLNIDFLKLNNIPSFYYKILTKNPKTDNKRCELLRSLLQERIKNAKTIILNENRFTKDFLKEVQKLSAGGITLSESIKKAFQELDSKSPKYRIIKDFLESLEARDVKDLEMKIEEKIRERTS